MKIESLFKLLLILATAYAVLYFSKKRTQKTEGNTIIVGTNAEYPPFSFIKDGVTTGFDIDVIKEVGKRLKKNIQIKDMPFNSLIPELQLGKVQIIAAGMSPTPERAKQVLFSTSYLTGDPLLIISLAKDNPITNIEDLKGKNVVVNQGYTADAYMSNIKGPNIKRLNAPADAFMALKSGRAFAFVSAKSSVQPYFEQYGTQQFNIFTIPDTADEYALVISPKYKKLKKEINKALENMLEDGTIEALKEKWKLS